MSVTYSLLLSLFYQRYDLVLACRTQACVFALAVTSSHFVFKWGTQTSLLVFVFYPSGTVVEGKDMIKCCSAGQLKKRPCFCLIRSQQTDMLSKILIIMCMIRAADIMESFLIIPSPHIASYSFYVCACLYACVVLHTLTSYLMSSSTVSLSPILIEVALRLH